MSSCRRSRWSPTPTARSEDESLVTLMTLHNAKGLEYPTVFITGCEDGVFPHSRAIDEGELEEERRLFYVGVTRAMRALYLTYARRRAVFGAQTSGMRSRFLDEIPAELVDEPQESVRWGAGQRMGPIHAGVGGTGTGRGVGVRASRRRGLGRAAAGEGSSRGRISPGRGRGARGLRRGRRHRRRARRGDRRALRRRRLRAQADGRVRAGQPSLTPAGDPCPQPSSIRSVSARIIDGKAIAARVRGGVAARGRGVRRSTAGARPGWPPCWSAMIRRRRCTSGASSARAWRSGMVPFDRRLQRGGDPSRRWPRSSKA